MPVAPTGRRGRGWWYGLAAGAALLLAGGVGGSLGRRGPQAQPTPAALIAEAPGPALPVPEEPPPKVAPAAPTSLASTVSPSPPVPPQRNPSQGRTPRPAVRQAAGPLSEQALHAVVQNAHPRFVACMKRHAAELPGGSGQLKIELAVQANGAVSSARAALPAAASAELASCLEREAHRLRFPRHSDQELRFAFPLVYRRGD